MASNRLGIIPAAGKARRFGGVLKELLPLPNGVSFIAEAVLRLRNYCDDIVVVTSEEKIRDHSLELGGNVFYAIQEDERDIYGAMVTGMHFDADHYLFTMPDTYMPRNSFSGYCNEPFAMGMHETMTPERFGCLTDGLVINKNENIPTPAQAWGLLAWSRETKKFWKAWDVMTYTDAINVGISNFDYVTWNLGFYHDNASIEDYMQLLRKDLK